MLNFSIHRSRVIICLTTRWICDYWPWPFGLNWYHLKLWRKTKQNLYECVVLHSVGSFWIVLLGLLCPFMLSIVSKMENVSTFMSTTLNQTDPKKRRTFATLFATCMSGGSIPEREVHRQVTYRCHLSCQAQGFPWNGGKRETGWKHLYYEWQMFIY